MSVKILIHPGHLEVQEVEMEQLNFFFCDQPQPIYL